METKTKNAAGPSAPATGSVLVPFFKHGPMVMLHVACNDGDTGMLSSKCEALEIQYGRDLDDRLSFSPNFFDWSPAFVVDWEKHWLQIGGLPRINYTKYGVHGGNWCWDCFKVRREDAANLIAHPKIRKWFSLDEAPTDLWEAYHGRPSRMRRTPKMSHAAPESSTLPEPRPALALAPC